MTKILRYFTLATILIVVGCFTYQNVQDYKESFAKCGTPEMVEQKENGTSSTDNASVPEPQAPIGGINFGHSETYPTEEGVNVTTTQNEGVNMSNTKTYPSSTGHYTIGNFQSTAIFQTEARPGDGQPMELEDVTTCFNYPYVDIGTVFTFTYENTPHQYRVFESTGCDADLISNISALPLVEKNTNRDILQIYSRAENGKRWLIRAERV